MTQSRFVTAWDKKSGEKRRIPKRWLDTPLGEPFTTTEPKAAPSAPAVSDSATATTKAADVAAKGK